MRLRIRNSGFEKKRFGINLEYVIILKWTSLVLSRARHSANSFANSANRSIGNAVAEQSEDLPAVVAKSLDDWVVRTRGIVTPNCFPSLYRET